MLVSGNLMWQPVDHLKGDLVATGLQGVAEGLRLLDRSILIQLAVINRKPLWQSRHIIGHGAFLDSDFSQCLTQSLNLPAQLAVGSFLLS